MVQRHALVVDDDSLSRELLVTMLERLEVVACQAGDGHSALRLLEGEGFDLVLLDLRLPDLDSEEVVRRIRATAKVPILIISGTGCDEAAETCKRLDCAGFLCKPFRFEQFQVAVSPLLSAAGGSVGEVDR